MLLIPWYDYLRSIPLDGYYYSCLDFQKVSLFQISMFRFVYMLETNYASATSSTFGCGQVAKFGKTKK